MTTNNRMDNKSMALIPTTVNFQQKHIAPREWMACMLIDDHDPKAPPHAWLIGKLFTNDRPRAIVACGLVSARLGVVPMHTLCLNVVEIHKGQAHLTRTATLVFNREQLTVLYSTGAYTYDNVNGRNEVLLVPAQ